MTPIDQSDEILKKRAKVIREFIKAKYGVDVKHGHCLEIVSLAHGVKNWATASPMAKSEENKLQLPVKIETVGDMKRLMEHFKDDDVIDADFTYKAKDVLETIEEVGYLANIHQEFSLSFEGFNDNIVTFQLKVENEDAYFETEDGGFIGGDISLMKDGL